MGLNQNTTALGFEKKATQIVLTCYPRWVVSYFLEIYTPFKGAMPEKKREELRARRESLFKRFEKNREEIHLALEIKIIDDQIADFTHLIKQKRKTQR